MTERGLQGITQLLIEWRAGDRQALDQLTPIVYQELRRLAHHYMKGERPLHTLQTTALIHEAYIRLIDLKLGWQDRNHFFAVAASMMRRILTDFARRRKAAKRGGGITDLPLDDAHIAAQPAWYLVALDDALKDLDSFDQRKSKIVELRYFGGLTIQETAAVLELSRSTVDRELKMAKAWLYQEIDNESMAASP